VAWQVLQSDWLRLTARPDADGRYVNLPEFIKTRAGQFLGCGLHSSGFARVRCGACHESVFVPFSCKVRGMCASCDGKRMAQQAAYLLDEVLPRVHYRQWVFTLPHWLRASAAFDHALMSKLLAAWTAAVRRYYRRKARTVLGGRRRGGRAGQDDKHRRSRRRALSEGAGDRKGLEVIGISVIQRFGDGLRLNPHVHSLFADGVYVWPDGRPPDAGPVFMRLPAPTDDEVQAVAQDAAARALQVLARAGHDVDALQHRDDAHLFDEAADEAPSGQGTLALAMKACLLDRVAIGPRAGHSIERLWRFDPALLDRLYADADHARPPREKPRRPKRCAGHEGFEVHATTAVRAKNRVALERLVRYLLRPAVPNQRLRLRDDGRVEMRFKRVWRDGTAGFVFDRLDFLLRLVSLIPAPKTNLLRYHGQLAPAGRWRAYIALGPGRRGEAKRRRPPRGERERQRRATWAELMQRCFLIDVLKCSCGGRREVVALVRAGKSAERYLKHAGLPHEAPTFARPPLAQLTFDDAADTDHGWFDQRPPTDEDDDMWWSASDLDAA
jgi:hypothetical protein